MSAKREDDDPIVNSYWKLIEDTSNCSISEKKNSLFPWALMGEVAITGIFQTLQTSAVNTEKLCCFYSSILFSVTFTVWSVGPNNKFLTSAAFGGKVLTSYDSFLTTSQTLVQPYFFFMFTPPVVSSNCSYVDFLKHGLSSPIFLILLFRGTEIASSQGFFLFFSCGDSTYLCYL